MAEKEVVLFDSPAVSVVKPVAGEEEEVVDVGDVRYVTIAMVEFVDNVVEGVVVILSVESVSNNVLSSIRSFWRFRFRVPSVLSVLLFPS